MKRETVWMPATVALPVVELLGTRYVIDLKLGYFRQVASPYESIPFNSYQGTRFSDGLQVTKTRI